MTPTHTIESVATLEGHDDRVWDIAWNPVQPLLASCSADKFIRIASYTPISSGDVALSTASATEPSSFFNISQIPTGHRRTVRTLAWSPSGSTLAAGSFDSTISVWEREGNDGDWECAATLEGHETEVKCVAYNAEGNMLATCGRDKSVWIWEVNPEAEFECLSVQMEHSQDVKSVTWHPTHDLLASCSYDDTIKLYVDDPSDDWFPFSTLSGHTNTVWDLAFSPCGRFFATVSEDMTVRIWRTKDDSLRQWECMRIIEGAHSRAIYSVTWTRGLLYDEHQPSGGRGWLASTGGDGRINETGGDGVDAALVARLDESHGVCDVNVVRWCPRSGHENILASAGDDQAVRVWRVRSTAAT